MTPELGRRANLGRRVALASDPRVVGTVTLDLRHEHQRPPWSHVSLYVRWDVGSTSPGVWIQPGQHHLLTDEELG